MTPMLFRNLLPLRPRKEMVALEKLSLSLGEMNKTCGALTVHARTKAQRAEWQSVSTRVRVTYQNSISAIEAIRAGKDIWELIEQGIILDFPQMFRLVGEVDALGRLYVRTVGTAAYTDVGDRVADVYGRVVRLYQTHAENNPALPLPAAARKGVLRVA